MGGDNMLKIAVVDDENSICSFVEKELLRLSKKYGILSDVDVYYSGEELIKAINETFFDVIFLDIKMKELSGIDVSCLIRNKLKNESTQIVYITGNTEYALEVFDYDPFHFLAKPLDSSKIEKAFMKLIHKLNLKAESFTYKVGHDSFKVPIKDIIFFESHKREITIHYYDKQVNDNQVNDKEEVFYGSLENILMQLSKYNFLFIHKSYLINPIHVRKCTYEEVEMSNHVKLRIAQSKRKEIREKQLELFKDEEA